MIRETARRLTGILGGTGMAARLGGDEFAVILANCHFEAQIEDISRRLIEAFRQPFDTGQGERIKCASASAAPCARSMRANPMN